MKNRSTKNGSAILIVMLLVTVLATVAMTVGYMALAEVSMETSSQDGMVAYYAAEAGIEDGLLRYRYDNNVEVGNYKNSAVSDPENKACGVAGNNKDCGDRVQIYKDNTGADKDNVTQNQDLSILPTDPTKEHYDLRIKYKTNGEIAKTDYSSNISATDKKLEKDQSIWFEGTADNKTVFLKYQANDSACSTLGKCYIQFKGTNLDVFGTKDIVDVADINEHEKQVEIEVNQPFEIKFWDNNNSSTADRSISYKMKVVDSRDESIDFDSGVTTIESTGYYGSAKRRLQATIDRKTGKLLEIFDFTLNSVTGKID